MGATSQNSNPWQTTMPRGAQGGPSSVPGGGSNPWAGVAPRGAGGGPSSVPGGGSNQFAGWAPRGAGVGTMGPGAGVSPAGPSTTMPGTWDPTIGMETGGPSNPMVGTRTPMGPPTLPGSMNSSFGGVGQAYTGPSGGGTMTGQNTQQGPMNSGQGQFFGQRDSVAGAQMDNQGYVKSLYSGLLGRDASSDEVSNASQALSGQYGGNRGALEDFFKNSAEYKARPQAQPNAYGGPGSGLPFDPRTQGYQPGAGWQTMLRQYARTDGQQNPNQYVQDRGLSPMWGQQQQSWEPQAAPNGMGLSELLRSYRGY